MACRLIILSFAGAVCDMKNFVAEDDVVVFFSFEVCIPLVLIVEYFADLLCNVSRFVCEDFNCM